MLDTPTFLQMPLAMAVAYAFLRERKSHTSVLFEAAVLLPGLAKSCSALPITRSTVPEHSSTVTSELLCTTAGHSCCSASVMLNSRALQLRSDLETSPLSLLRRMPNQVAWKRRLHVNQRLFRVFRSSAFRRARRFRGDWLICPGCLPDQGPRRQSVAELLRDDFTLP